MEGKMNVDFKIYEEKKETTKIITTTTTTITMISASRNKKFIPTSEKKNEVKMRCEKDGCG